MQSNTSRVLSGLQKFHGAQSKLAKFSKGNSVVVVSAREVQSRQTPPPSAPRPFVAPTNASAARLAAERLFSNIG